MKLSTVLITFILLIVLTACPAGHAVGLRWTSVASSYHLYRSSDGVNFVLVATQSATVYVDQNVAAGQHYWYKVAAVQPAGNEIPSNVVTAVIPN